MPKYCANCGSGISDKVKFCPECGSDIESFSLKKDEKSIVEENKKSAKVWYNKGVDFTESNEYEKASLAYENALTFDAKDADIWNNKCFILTKLGKCEEAIKAGNIAVELAPNDPVLWDTLSDAYIACNNREKADECQKIVIKLQESLKMDEGSVRHFLYIPISRYIIMSLITFGLYQIYWIFKNWEYLKKRDGMDIHPFWRGIFGIFYCHELLRAIHDDVILNKNKPAQFNHSALATGWVIIVIISNLFNRISGTLKSDNLVMWNFVIIIVLLVIELSFFIPVQRYVNEVNEMINPDVNYYPWSLGHFVLIGIAVVIFGIGFSSGSGTG